MTSSRHAPYTLGYTRATLGKTKSCEFHADVSFWRFVGGGRVRFSRALFSAPLYRSYMQPPAFTLWSDASGDAMGGYFLGPEPGSGVWWRVGLDADVRTRLRTTVKGWNDLSMCSSC